MCVVFIIELFFDIMKHSPLTQPAENGAYPQLMCATELDLDKMNFMANS